MPDGLVRVHTVPVNDTHPHVTGGDYSCPCHPDVYMLGRHVVHNAFDKRDRGEPPSWVPPNGGAG